jgi:hypothetical protein
LYFSDTSGAVACNGGDTTYGPYYQFTVQGNTNDFCTATLFTNDLLPLLDYGGVFYISDGTISREVQQYGGSSSTTFEQHGTCVACPTPTPTATTVPPTATPTSTPVPPTPTSTETPTPTPTATPVPPTATPTSTPTPTPTPTATPDQTADWQNNGSFTCVGCDKHNVEFDYNQYSPTYSQTRTGSLVESNSTFCYVEGTNCCGQSTTADWQWSGDYVCDGLTKYQEEVDNNSCSPTFGQTRTGTFVEANSPYCGYTPPPTATPTSTPVPPTATPLPTSTPVPPTATPVPPATYDFYTADEYGCAEPCGVSAYNQIVSFPAGSSVSLESKFYTWTGGSSSYMIIATTTDPSVPVPLLSPADGPYDNCTQACNSGGV